MAFIKHGFTRTQRSTYQCWSDMKSRCLNPNHAQFKNYGERGIRICDRWIDDFSAFFADMGAKPNGKTLDRRDNESGYSLENCRWATASEQRANQRDVVQIDVNGYLVPRDEAARMVGLHPATLQWRLNNGWSSDKALTTPPDPKNNMTRANRQRAAMGTAVSGEEEPSG